MKRCEICDRRLWFWVDSWDIVIIERTTYLENCTRYTIRYRHRKCDMNVSKIGC